MLFDPARHEPLLDIDWDAARVRAAIAAIVAEMEENAGDRHHLALAPAR